MILLKIMYTYITKICSFTICCLFYERRERNRIHAKKTRMRKKKLLMLIESVSHWTFQSFVRSVFSYYPVRDLVTLSLYRPLLCRLTRPVTGTSSMIEFCFVRDTTHRFRRRVLLVPVFFFIIFVISVTLTIGRLQPVSGEPRNRSSHADIPHFTRALNSNMLI